MTDQQVAPTWLRPSTDPLGAHYDVGLLDLDGTVYTGAVAIPGAAAAVAAARAIGMRVGYVTNNASRTPETVAEHLSGLGLPATRDDVLTSSQAAAALLAQRLPGDAPVLVIGGAGLVAAVTEQGLRPVASADDGPVAVIQGWAPEVGWSLLAEGAYALSRGLPWVATNTDLTLPTARGIAPGNGSFVALLSNVVGRLPDEVVGKPHPGLLTQAARQFSATHPLVVGDRLDTDIEGAGSGNLPSLLVLTGVTGVEELLAAPRAQRPTYVAADLAGLLAAHVAPKPAAGGAWSCGAWTARVNEAGHLTVEPNEEGMARPGLLDGLRAACAAAWTAADQGVSVGWDARLVSVLGTT